jgi:hypothetical protein
VALPVFAFRIAADDVARYRDALGDPGPGIPFAMALRALAAEPVAGALQEIAQGRIPVHLGQDVEAAEPLCAAVDYACEVTLRLTARDRLRIEQTLRGEDGRLLLRLASDVALLPA